MKLKVTAWASASAIVTGAVYLICSFGVSAFPAFSKSLAQSWFHGFDFSTIWNVAPRGNFVLGLVSAVVGMWLVGWAFAWTYNKLVK